MGANAVRRQLQAGELVALRCKPRSDDTTGYLRMRVSCIANGDVGWSSVVASPHSIEAGVTFLAPFWSAGSTQASIEGMPQVAAAADLSIACPGSYPAARQEGYPPDYE